MPSLNNIMLGNVVHMRRENGTSPYLACNDQFPIDGAVHITGLHVNCVDCTAIRDTAHEQAIRETRVIRITMLDEVGACHAHKARFVKLFPVSEFPDGVAVSEALAARYADQFDFNWGLDFLIARRDWHEMAATIENAWDEAHRQAWQAFGVADKLGNPDCSANLDAALRQGNREHRIGYAKLFAQLWLAQGGWFAIAKNYAVNDDEFDSDTY